MKSYISALTAAVTFALGCHVSTFLHANSLSTASGGLFVPDDNWLQSLLPRGDSSSDSQNDASTTNRKRNANAKRSSRYNEILRELHEMSDGDLPSNFTCPEPLILFPNKLVWEVNMGEGGDVDIDIDKPIPRILHVSHKSRCLPPDFHANLQAWGRALPQFSIVFYDDEAVEKIFWHPLVTTAFPMLNHIRKCAVFKTAMKVDLWRVLITYVYGGLYSDIDNTPTEAWNEGIIRADNVTGVSLSDAWNRVSQWLFATAPNHPGLYYAMQFIQKELLEMNDIMAPRTVFVTGPHPFNIGIRHFLYGEEFHTNNSRILPPVDGDNEWKHYAGIEGKLWRKYTGNDYKYQSTFMKEKVTYGNITLTRKERAQKQSNTVHWRERVVWLNEYGDRVNRSEHRSCKKQLQLVDTDPNFLVRAIA